MFSGTRKDLQITQGKIQLSDVYKGHSKQSNWKSLKVVDIVDIWKGGYNIGKRQSRKLRHRNIRPTKGSL